MSTSRYLKNETIRGFVRGKDIHNRSSFNWPIPSGESFRIPSIYIKDDLSTRREEKILVPSAGVKKEIEEFIDFALSHLKVSKRMYFSKCRFHEIVKARALIAYAVRTRWRLTARDAAPFTGRDYSSMNTLQLIAVREYGPSMQAVSDLLKAWDEKVKNKSEKDNFKLTKGYYGDYQKVKIIRKGA